MLSYHANVVSVEENLGESRVVSAVVAACAHQLQLLSGLNLNLQLGYVFQNHICQCSQPGRTGSGSGRRARTDVVVEPDQSTAKFYA